MTEIQQESDFKTIAIGDRVKQVITNIVYCFKARKPAYIEEEGRISIFDSPLIF